MRRKKKENTELSNFFLLYLSHDLSQVIRVERHERPPTAISTVSNGFQIKFNENNKKVINSNQIEKETTNSWPNNFYRIFSRSFRVLFGVVNFFTGNTCIDGNTYNNCDLKTNNVLSWFPASKQETSEDFLCRFDVSKRRVLLWISLTKKVIILLKLLNNFHSNSIKSYCWSEFYSLLTLKAEISQNQIVFAMIQRDQFTSFMRQSI